MKRNVISLILALVLCLSLSVTAFAAGESLVLDGADLLTDAEELTLARELETISRTHNAQVVVVTVADSGYDPDRYISDLYDNMGFGYGADHDGVMLLVCMDVREYRILSNGFAADAIRPGQIDSISNAIVSDLSDGWYADAFHTYAQKCDYYLDGYRNGYPFPLAQNLLIAIAVGLVVGLIVALVLKGQLRSVHQQRQANVYVKDGSLELTACHDRFLYRNVHRERKETESSRSGSSRNIGGGSF